MNLEATAKAFANVALVKYFGKRDIKLNLPDAPSLSLTLSPLQTITKLTFKSDLNKDTVFINGESAPEKFTKRITAFLDIAREIKQIDTRAVIDTSNSFPTAAGLASSASGFAALSVAVNSALNLNLNKTALSSLARRGSGSASRSIFGGFVKWNRGDNSDGTDSTAMQIKNSSHWDLRMLVGVVQTTPKKTGSTDGMIHTKKTSPYYVNWTKSAFAAVKEAENAIIKKDFQKLGEITEHSALSMHGAIMASSPAILYLKGVTIDAYHLVQNLRNRGIPAYFTCDAGPQPKILCEAHYAHKIEAELSMLAGIKKVIHCKIGDDAEIIKPFGSSTIDKCMV